jgi:hypothetical protein
MACLPDWIQIKSGSFS